MTQPRYAYRVLTDAEWMVAEKAGRFDGSAIDREDGFIHLSTYDQVSATIDKYFKDNDNLVIVEIDLSLMGDAVRWEVSRGGALFPHLYAPLEWAWVRRMARTLADLAGD